MFFIYENNIFMADNKKLYFILFLFIFRIKIDGKNVAKINIFYWWSNKSKG